ncbi:chorionic somatomammotropin hormone 2-like [Oryx dammah]|uniref:chorionic somatomammotropin hormone 2-like n=1 Tax=Oryx dammah TaxID=59534 RepID=UPI001A9C1AD4|nr:chorionic somatomammotropin hormone 2-like [Oryx dammah]
MAPAPSFRGHQWTYNPVRGSCLLLLLVVMSNLLLCQGKSCPSCSPYLLATSMSSLTDLFIEVAWLSHDFHNLSTIVFKEFNETYAQGKLYHINATNSCHTNVFDFPEERDKAHQLNNENITKWTLVLLYCWNNPLYHLVKELDTTKELPETFLSSLTEIENMSERLQAFIESHFRKIIVPVLKIIRNAPSVWSEHQYMKSRDEDRRHSEMYNLFHCLHRDSRKVDMYFKILACRARKTC